MAPSSDEMLLYPVTATAHNKVGVTANPIASRTPIFRFEIFMIAPQ